MEPGFWHEKWETDEIRFHEQATNPLLVRNLPALGLGQGARVLVPLCGKSLDIHYLLKLGHRVVGSELSAIAVRQLFAECGLVPRAEPVGKLQRYESGPLTVYAGDFFDLDADVLGPVDAVYDRAALVALPPAMRERYVSHLLAATSAAPQLLACFEYEAALFKPPPHSIDQTEVQRHYGTSHRVTMLERYELPAGMRGRRPVFEGVYLLQRP